MTGADQEDLQSLDLCSPASFFQGIQGYGNLSRRVLRTRHRHDQRFFTRPAHYRTTVCVAVRGCVALNGCDRVAVIFLNDADVV